jgi:hypothetical protein
MNLRARILGPIFLSAIFFFSCENDFNKLGLDKDGRLGTRFVELEVPASVVWMDSVNTTGIGRLLVGKYSDEAFGDVFAQSYSHLIPSVFRPSFLFAIESVYDSITLELRADYYYGDNVGMNQQVQVFQLGDTLPTNRGFYSFDQATTGQKLGEITFKPSLFNLRVSVDSALRNPTQFESNGRYIYVARTRLDDNYGEDLFNKAKSGAVEFDSLRAFNIYAKGLAFIPDPGNEGVMGFNSTATTSRLVVHYHDFDANGEIVRKTYNITFNNFTQFTNLEPNREVYSRGGTPLAGLNQVHTPYDPGNGKLYQQAGAGVAVKLDFSFLEAIRDTLPNLVIDHAILQMSGFEGVNDALLPPALVRYYHLDADNKFVRVREGNRTFFRALQDETRSSNPRGLGAELEQSYNAEKNQINPRMTLFVQSVVDGEMDLKQLVIWPASSSSSVNRFVVDQANIKLKIYYTKPNL